MQTSLETSVALLKQAVDSLTATISQHQKLTESAIGKMEHRVQELSERHHDLDKRVAINSKFITIVSSSIGAVVGAAATMIVHRLAG